MRSAGEVAGQPLDSIPLEREYRFAAAASESAMHSAFFYAFNTEITLQAFGDELLVREAFDQARSACRRFERLFSRTLAHSDISRLNAAGGAVTPIDNDTFDLLRMSIEYCENSLGLFDITVGSICRLWDFRHEIIPSPEVIETALPHVDFRHLQLGGEPGSRTAQLRDPLAAVDVGGTAKGYIADRLSEMLADAGLTHFIINLGGNVVVHGGKPDGSPFRVGIRDPKDPSQSLGAVPLHTGSVVTSGLTERAFMLDGVRYCHILNPKTGYPISTDAESATIVARSSSDCDGYSTTLCALGIERGIEFARQRPEIELAIFVDAKNKLHTS